MDFLDAAGITLHVRRDARADGTGRAASADDTPTLVHLHSLGAELRIWDGVVARLPHHAHLRVDLRGHGTSEVPAGDTTIGAMTRDVLAALDAVGVRRVVAVGVSVGGQVALRMALARPDRVAGVVALDTAARIGDESTWNARIAEVRRGGVAAIADAVVARWFGPGFEARDPVTTRGYRQMLLRTPAAGYLATCAALRDEDLTDELPSLTRPVLVVCGRHDTATPPELVRGLARALPFGRYEEIADAAHLPCIDRPDDTARLIGAFLRSLATT